MKLRLEAADLDFFAKLKKGSPHPKLSFDVIAAMPTGRLRIKP
jgi:hypothetical protein